MLSKTGRDVGSLSESLKSKQENSKIEEIQPHELNDFLNEFIVTVKRKDGGDYEPSRLRGFSGELQSSLGKREVFKEHRRRSRVGANKEGAGCSFGKFLKKEGRGNRPFAAEAIRDDEESVLM